MPQKHHGEVEFLYPNGLFKNSKDTNSVELYHIYEQEIQSNKSAEISFFDTDSILLIYGMSGKGTLIVDSHKYNIHPYSVIIIPASDHAVYLQTSKSVSYMCMAFSVSMHTLSKDLLRFLTLIQRNTVLYADNAPRLLSFITGLIGELILEHVDLSLVKGMIEQILISAYRNFVHCRDCREDYERASHIVGHTVYTIVKYIDENLYSIHNLSDMAKELGYSYNYLSHLFRRKTGSTIQSYVSRKKIEKSTELLSDGHYSVTEIAALLNYDCIQSFSKAFKKAMGVSPTEYRESVELTICSDN